MKEKEIPQIELLTPLSGTFYPDEREFDEEMDDGYGEILDGADLAQYETAIQEKVDWENGLGMKEQKICNLMDYFDRNEVIKRKVESAVVSVKNVDDVLYGCTTLTLNEFLDVKELEELCEYITGQYSDGWGESFEQRDIQVDGGTLNVHFWQEQNFHIQEKQPDRKECKTEQPVKKPKLKLIGHDGNIFSIMGDARRLLCANGQEREAEEMIKRVTSSGNYYKALHIVSEYVETELSSPKQEKGGKSKNPTKGECR